MHAFAAHAMSSDRRIVAVWKHLIGLRGPASLWPTLIWWPIKSTMAALGLCQHVPELIPRLSWKLWPVNLKRSIKSWQLSAMRFSICDIIVILQNNLNPSCSTRYYNIGYTSPRLSLLWVLRKPESWGINWGMSSKHCDTVLPDGGTKTMRLTKVQAENRNTSSCRSFQALFSDQNPELLLRLYAAACYPMRE